MRKKDFTDVKLFFTFFFISSFFIYWTSWNEETNFYVLFSFFKNKNFILDDFINKTGDRVYRDGHYYPPSNKIFFASILSFFYAILKNLLINENSIKAVLTIFSSSLPFSLLMVIMYKFSKSFIGNRKRAILVSLLLGFSTLLFQQSRFFTSHSLEAFFLFLSFYFFIQFLRDNKIINITFSSIFLTTSLFLTPIARIILILYMLSLLTYRKWYILFTFSSLIFLIYAIFFSSLLNLMGASLWQSRILPELNEKEVFLPFYPLGWKEKLFYFSTILQLLFFPSKGLFFYYPILIFSFLGFLSNFRKIENILSLIFILSTFFLFPFYSGSFWWFGWISYGPVRILTILMPFFFVGLLSSVKKFNIKILLPFFFISIFNNFLLLQYGEDKISTLSWEEFSYKMEHFQVLSNPLFEHYLPLTLINGPRSVLLENLLINKEINIDLKHPFNPITPEFIPPGSPLVKKFEVYLFTLPQIGFVVLRLPWLSLFIAIVFLILIWKDEILSKIKIKGWVLFLMLTLVFLVFFIRIRDFAYGDNWCAPQWNENEKRIDEGRWIGENATFFLFSKEKSIKILRLKVESFQNQTLEIYSNRKFVGSYSIEKNKVIIQPFELKEGFNEIMLRTKGNFIKPWSIGINCDIDNISLKVLIL